MNRKQIRQLIAENEDKDDVLDQIMKINGEDIENAKSTIREELNAEVEKYKALSKEVDKTEFERLKSFETETIEKEKKAKTTDAVRAILEKNKVKKSLINRELKSIDFDSVELDKDGKITEAWEKTYMDGFRADIPDGFETAPIGTGIPSAQGYGGKQQTASQRNNTEWATAIAERTKNN